MGRENHPWFEGLIIQCITNIYKTKTVQLIMSQAKASYPARSWHSRHPKFGSKHPDPMLEFLNYLVEICFMKYQKNKYKDSFYHEGSRMGFC